MLNLSPLVVVFRRLFDDPVLFLSLLNAVLQLTRALERIDLYQDSPPPRGLA